MAGQGVEANLRKLSAIIVTNDGIGDSQAMDVSHNTFQPLSTGIISNYHSCVSHQLGWKGHITRVRKRIQSQTQESISQALQASSLNINPVTITQKYTVRYLWI